MDILDFIKVVGIGFIIGMTTITLIILMAQRGQVLIPENKLLSGKQFIYNNATYECTITNKLIEDK